MKTETAKLETLKHDSPHTTHNWPELLEALKSAADALSCYYDSSEEGADAIMKEHGKTLAKARAAIRKAKGEL